MLKASFDSLLMSQLGKRPPAILLAVPAFVRRMSRKVLPSTLTFAPREENMYFFHLARVIIFNNPEISGWLVFQPVSLNEAASHIHYVSLLSSRSGKNLIAVSVKILYIETFVEVAKTACFLTSAFYTHLADKDALQPALSYRRPQRSRVLPEAMQKADVLFKHVLYIIPSGTTVPYPPPLLM